MAALLIENQNLVYDGTPGWIGYNIPRLTDTDLTFRNNYISSDNTGGYMLIAGDESVGAYNNNLDGAIIENNYFDWNGTLAYSIITHGIFGGYNINYTVRYNYLDNVPMGIIRKSNGMTDVSGVVAYNIIKNPAPGVVCKGMNGVRIYNNTFYSNLTSSVCNRHMIEIYENEDITPHGSATGTKIKNNIFYTVNTGIRSISISEVSCLTNFECDYNLYWCENNTNNEPTFNYLGSTYTWTQWRALGYDSHSVIINPHFHSVDSSTGYSFIPERRLNYGINLGLDSLVSHGIDYENTWSTTITDGIPLTQIQDSNWQVGAVVLRTGNNIGGDWYLAPWGSDTLGDGSFNKPYFTLNKLWTVVSAGDTCYMRGGDYDYTSRQYLTGKSGTVGNLINIYAYQDEIPNITEVTTFTRGTGAVIYFVGDYVHFKGIEISYYPQTYTDEITYAVMSQNSDNNIFELFNIHDCGFGMHIGDTSTGNLILNCDIYNIYDPYSTSGGVPDPYEDGDGFSLGYNNAGTINTFRGCRAWNCCDDGFDFWRCSGELIIENCWTWGCGYREDGITEGGNGNGFKLGVTGDVTPWTGYEGQHLRTIQNCMAFNNRVNGFDQNAALCLHYFYNNIAFGNGGRGFSMTYGTDAHIVRNNIELSNGSVSLFNSSSVLDHNTFNYDGTSNGSYNVSIADFITTIPTGITGKRQYDGSLPILNFLHLTTGSDLIHTGVTISGITTDGDGKDWYTTPSLGTFEYVTPLTGYYVATFGSNSTGTGTFSNPYATLKYAWDQRAAAGVTIYMRGGIYEIDNYISLGVVSGTAGNTINVYNFPGEQPTIKPSVIWLNSTQTSAIYVRSNYCHFKGLEIVGFVQRKYASYSAWEGTTSFQFYECSYCTAELLNCHHGGFGPTINGLGSTGNLLLNCDSHHNYDPYTLGYEYGGIDGITIRVESVGTSHTMRGCRMWNNSDDGVDLWASTGLITIDKCWSWNNGYREDGITTGGDGGGFKLGPVVNDPYTGHENEHLRTIINNIAYHNRENGFTQNAAYCIIHFYNNTAYLNVNLGIVLNNLNTLNHIVRNNLCYNNYSTSNGGRGYVSSIATTDHNTFLYDGTVNGNYNVTDIDFVSLDSTGLDGERQSDGSLPLLTFLHLAEGSDLINTGIDVDVLTDGDGNPWHSSTPSLGAFEYLDYITPPTVTTTSLTLITTTTASSGGNVTSDNGSLVTIRGVCWNTSTNPTIANSKTSNGTGTGIFTSSITGLTANTLYYVRAYATNAEGTSYGNEVSFRTNVSVVISTVTTTVMSLISYTTATSGGNVLSDGNATVTAKGVCWNTSTAPTISNSHTTDGTGIGSYISNLTGLVSSTHYYVRAYATNSVGTAYGSEIEFDTLTLPVVTNLTDGLSAFWKMNDGSGTIIDSVGSYDLTPASVVPSYLQVGKKGFSIDFSSTSTWVARSNIVGLIPTGSVFSISYWVYFNELPSTSGMPQQLIYFNNTSTPKYFLSSYININDRIVVYFKTSDGGYCESNSLSFGTIQVGQWYHIVGVAHGIGKLGNMYVNGFKINSYTTQTASLLQADGPLYIGNINAVVSVIEANARLDDIGFWNRELTDDEVIELYSAGNGLTYPFDGTEESFVYLNTPCILKFGIT